MASAFLAGASLAVPASADTESELNAAEQELAGLEAELDRINRLWLDAEASLARSQDAAVDARDRIAELEEQLLTIQVRLNERAASLFVSGGSPQVLALLTADSFTDVADRLEFASAIAQDDADLANQVSVQTQELTWQRERLIAAAEEERQALADLDAQETAIETKFAEYQARIAELEVQLAAEQAPPPSPASSPGGSPSGDGGGSGGGGGGDEGGEPTAGGGESDPPPVSGSGWLQTCPVAGASSFVDSFGDPRPGGRSHQGIDLIASRGTPVVAVHPGTVHRTSSSIGGNGVVLFHDGSGDWTFYTHFDSFGAAGEGAHVAAGQVIGYVGNTGTTVYHLHFEYHPGGGAAVNPYSSLLAAC